jgi:hypothetical protein
MRPTAMVMTTAALLLGVSAAGCGPTVAGLRGLRPTSGQHPADRAATGMKTVEYGGYLVGVPAAWPVYRLAGWPYLCVRYDTHAVYLGNPRPDQQCGAHLVGRTQAVRIEGDEARPAVSYQWGAGAIGQANGWPIGWPISGDTAERELGPTIQRPRLSITATFADDPAVAERIVGSVRAANLLLSQLPTPPARPRPLSARAVVGDHVPPRLTVRDAVAGPTRARAHARARVPAPARAHARAHARARVPAPGRAHARAHARARVPAPGRAHARAHARARVPAPGRAHAHAHARARPVRRPIAGFDTCTAPSIAAMRAWRPFYGVIAIYIGGVNRACDQGNLSARWVRQVKAMGWSLIPTYVGLQPPCDHFSGKIRLKRAASEGAAAARDAIARARGLHLGRHAPIYFDMEAYNSARKRCRRAVLTFLDAWTRQLDARAHVSGVYSSASSAVQDLGGTREIAGHPLARPRSIWFALWDGHVNVRGEPYLPASWWSRDQRIKQFRGSRWQRHGRFRLNIDRDEVLGAVYLAGMARRFHPRRSRSGPFSSRVAANPVRPAGQVALSLGTVSLGRTAMGSIAGLGALSSIS